MEKEGDRIASVLSRDQLTGARTRTRGTLFVDATGDGWVGYFAGADYMFGREGTKTFDESCAPDEPDLTTMSGRRLAVHGFAPREIAAIRVTVSSTYGDPSARIFEIMAY